MPELRLVVLAMQDRLAYAPTFDAALTSLFGAAVPSALRQGEAVAHVESTGAAVNPGADDLQALITRASGDLADYQRLTAEGKLGEAGQKLDDLKRTLEQLKARQSK